MFEILIATAAVFSVIAGFCAWYRRRLDVLHGPWITRNPE